MSRRRIVLLVAAVTALAGPVLLTPTQTTGAYWNEELTTTLPDARSDAFGITTTNVTTPIDHSQGTPLKVSNEPGISIKNNSERHTSWIDVINTRVTTPASNTTSTLLSKVNVDYAVSNLCTDAFSSKYWDVNGGVGGVTAGTTYERPSVPVTGGEVPPGQTKAVCPWVQADYTTSTPAGRRDLLLAQAGRQLDIATTLRQRSFSEGTWTSNQELVTTRYQVKLPPPTRRSSDNVVCGQTLSGGAWSDVGRYGRIYWAWPFAADGEGQGSGTTAINRFEVIRSIDGGNSWAPLRHSENQSSGAVYTNGGTSRFSEIILSNHLANNGPDHVFLSVRAYPYAGSSVYIDADWMTETWQRKVGATGYFQCRANGTTSSGVPNPNSSPVGLG